MVRAEPVAALWCLGELDEQPRRTVLLAYLYGFTREEISAGLGVRLGTVKTWIRRSVERGGSKFTRAAQTPRIRI